MLQHQFTFVVIFGLPVLVGKCKYAPTVDLPLGKVVGFVQYSFNGRPFASFEGIPYATPPVGSLRFRDPLPVKPWTKPVKAFNTSQCIQHSYSKNVVLGDEDCLHLNIYVPNLKPSRINSYPVLVHIHGGAFIIGSGNYYAQPHYLMDRNIILVTINYRLGIFGFLSTEDESSPGNYGMKDQILALKWIKQYIINFGGNPNSITIHGFSAGSSSVQFHYLSPLSKGLFHKAISFSGSALHTWVLQQQSLLKAKKLGVLTNCSIETSQILIDCLRKYPSHQLGMKIKYFYELPGQLLDLFFPVIDGSFLPDHPYKLLRDKKVHNVPWLSSTVGNEGILFGQQLIPFFDTFNKNIDLYYSLIFDYKHTLPQSRMGEVAKKISDYYFNGERSLSVSLTNRLNQAIGQRIFQVTIESAVRLHARAMEAPVYFFYYNRLGNHSFTQLTTKDNKVYDVTHGDNLLPIFTIKVLNSTIPLTESEIKMKDAMLDFIINFMKTGNAVFNKVKLKPVDRQENSDFVYLNITSVDNVKNYQVRHLKSYNFWNSLGFYENQNRFDRKN